MGSATVPVSGFSEIYLEIIRIKSQSLTAAGAGLFRPLQHQAAFRLRAQLINKAVLNLTNTNLPIGGPGTYRT